MKVVGGDNTEDHRDENDDKCRIETAASIAQIKVAVTELLSPLAITICFAFFVVNLVFC